MAVALDAVGPSAAGASSTGSNSLSWTHTAAAAGVPVLIGLAEGHNSGADGTLTVTYGGNTCSQLVSRTCNNGSFGRAVLFGIANQGSGAQTVSVSRSGGGTIQTLIGGSVSYTGASTSSPFGTTNSAFGASTAPAVTLAGTTAGNMAGGFAAIGDPTLSNPATSRWIKNVNALSAAGNAGQADKAGGGSLTFTWSGTTSSDWGAVVVEVLAAAAAAGLLPQQLWTRTRTRHARRRRLSAYR